MVEIGLVSCTKSKKEKRCEPKELYMESVLFRKARKYVEENHENWFILSARYGLLEPDGNPISPYDSTLQDMVKENRKAWAHQVFQELEDRNLLGNKFVIHTGKDYYEYLVELFEENGVKYIIPVEGLAYGERLSWYTSKNED